MDNVGSISKRFGGIFSPNNQDIIYTGTTTTSKHVSDHSNKNILKRKKSDEEVRLLSP